MKTTFVLCSIVLYCLTELGCSNNSTNTVENLPTFPHTYYGTTAYYAGDTLGTDFGVSFTMMRIEQVDSSFSASGVDTLKMNGISGTTPFNVTGSADDASHLKYTVVWDDGSNGIATFYSSKKDTLTVVLQSYLTTKFGTPYFRIYKVHK